MRKTLEETNDVMREMLREIKWSNKALKYVIITNILIIVSVAATMII